MFASRFLLLALCLLTIFPGSVWALDEAREWPILEGPYLGQTVPGMSSEVFAPGLISTESSYEMNSVFSLDGSEFYYGISASTPEEKAKGIYHYDLMFTEMVEGVWTRPTQLRIVGDYSVADIALSPDGERLYFCSEKPGIWESSEGFDIWYVERTGTGWSKPIHAGKRINSPFGETQPSFLSNGSMYFPSRRKGGDSTADLYYSEYSKGEYLEPVALPDSVNSVYGDGNSFVSPDGSYILFARWGMPESIEGGKGLFISFREKDGSWTDAKSTRPTTDLYGSLAALSPDQKYLFYSRGGDIYWVDARIIEDLKPDHLR